MENKKTQAGSNNQNSKGSANAAPVIFLSVFAILLAIAAGLLLRQVLESRAQVERAIYEKAEVVNEKEELTEKLNELEEEYVELSVKYEHLEGSLRQERARISRLRQELRGIDPVDARMYKEQIEELEEKLEEYREQARVMEAEKQSLASEKSQMQTTLNQANAQINELDSKKEDLEELVEKASYLTISELTAQGIRERRRRGDQPTDRARRTDKIQVCFTVNENHVAPAGNRDFFIRIIDPNNRVLSVSDANTFEFEGEEIVYTRKREVNFRNEPQNVCVAWNQPDRFEKGYYNAVVFTEGREVGYQLFQLD